MQPVGFYRPDLAQTNPGMAGLGTKNAILKKDSMGVAYGPHPSHQALSTADVLPNAPKGIVSVVTRNGNYEVYFGTDDKLYQVLANGTVTEIGSGYALPAGDEWGMAQFGDYLYFTNTFDGMLRYNLESPGTVDPVSGAPKARFIFVLFNTLAALDCDGNNRVMITSKINDAGNWGVADRNYQEFVDGEELIAGCELGSQYAVVFQRNAVRLLSRTRDRFVFLADQLGLGVGAQSASGVVPTRGWAYFVDTDGFHRTNGMTIEPIGEDKVSQTFVNSLAAGGLASCQGAFDPSNNRVLWRYRKSSVVSETVFEDILAYEIKVGEWVPIAMQTAAIVNMASPGYSLDELDQFGTMDTLPYSLDSRVWKGGEPRLAAVGSDLKFGFVAGDSLECTLETGETFDGRWGRFTGVAPMTDAETASVQCGVKRRLSDDLTWGDGVAIDDDGFAPVDEGGMVRSYRITIPAGESWSYMRGFEREQAVFGGPR